MSRDWLGIYARLLRLPKFRRLSDAAQLGLFYVWMLAGDADPEATWASLSELDELLVLCGRPDSPLEELVSGHWLDIDEDDAVSVHDWDQWQVAVTKDVERAYEARNKRKWRKEAAARKQKQDTTRHDITGVQGHVPDMSKDNGYSDSETGPWFSYGQEWEPVRKALSRKGFNTPPTGAQDDEKSQRGHWWKMVRDNAKLVARFVDEASPALNYFDLSAYVFRRWNDESGTRREVAG